MDDPNTFYTPIRMRRPFSPGAGGGGGGALALDAVTSFNTTTNTGQFSANHTPVSGAVSKVVVCVMKYNSNSLVGTITYGGESMGAAFATASVDLGAGDIVKTWWYGLLDPAAQGGTPAVVVDFDDTFNRGGLVVYTFTGGDLVDVFRASNSASGSAAASPSTVTVTTNAADIVLDAHSMAGNVAYTVGANQTQDKNEVFTTGNFGFHCHSHQNGADGGVMDWTWASGTRNWCASAVSVKG